MIKITNPKAKVPPGEYEVFCISARIRRDGKLQCYYRIISGPHTGKVVNIATPLEETQQRQLLDACKQSGTTSWEAERKKKGEKGK